MSIMTQALFKIHHELKKTSQPDLNLKYENCENRLAYLFTVFMFILLRDMS
jgi:hypothetical protein